jgi:CMP-N-acetylneuraminic acid synthetase
MLLDQPAHGACTMIRRDCLLEVGAYSTDFTCQDGVDLWLKIVERYPVRNVNLPLFYYRRHQGNLTNDDERLLTTRARIFRTHVEATHRPPLRTVAVVPVRGRIVDPHDLSLFPLGGRPLIDWTLETALATDAIHEVIVTTPDERVLDHVRKSFGDRVTTHHRRREQAGENVSFAAAVDEAVAQRRSPQEPDAIMELTVAYPLRDALYLGKAIDAMRIFDVDWVVSVLPENEVYYHHDGNGLRPLGNNGSASGLRLERDFLYRAAGGIAVSRRAARRAGKTVFDGRVGHIVISRRAAMRVSDRHEAVLVEGFLRDDATVKSRDDE